MKYFAFILFLLFSFNIVYSQQLIDSKQFMIGIKNVLSTDVVDHTIEPIGTYWEFVNENNEWIISSDPAGESSTITTEGESDFNNLAEWVGWNFFWLDTDPPNKDW